MHRGEPSLFWVHACLVAVQLGFASHHVASKVVLRELSPGALSLVRAASAAAVLFAVHAARRGLPRVPLRDLPLLSACALLGIAANQVCFFEGLARSTAINASVLVTTIPVFTVLTAIALRKEPASGRTLLGVAVALAGALYLVGVEAFELGPHTMVGDGLIALNALFYGVYLVLVTPLVQRHGSLTVVVWLFALGSLWIAPYGARDLVLEAPALGLGAWALVAVIVLVATVFTYLANAWALKHAPASIVAIYIYLQPIAAAALAVAVLGEAVTSRVALASLLVFTGIYLVTRRVTSAPPTDR
ncbi:MAG TPA: DMT family transporter [Sandaracinaceae bacterium]